MRFGSLIALGVLSLLCATAALGNSRQAGASGTIRWVLDHEPRGQSLRAAHISIGSLVGSHWQPVRFARVLQPDAKRNARIAVSLIGKHGRNMCMTVFLGRAPRLGGCGVGSGLRPVNASRFSDHGNEAIAGLAKDGVARVVLVDSSRRRHDVALKDNALFIKLRDTHAVKLLSFDRHDRLIGTTILF